MKSVRRPGFLPSFSRHAILRAGALLTLSLSLLATSSCGSGLPLPAGLPRAKAPNPSSLPSVIYDIDPALSVGTNASEPGIQVDAGKLVQGITLNNTARTRITSGTGHVKLITNAPEGFPYFEAYSGGSGANSLVFPPRAADPIVSSPGQPFTIMLVIRTRALGGSELMKLYGNDYANTTINLNFLPNGGTGRWAIGQTNTAGNATEPAAPALNQWDLIYYIYDGQHYYLYRNGAQVIKSGATTSGGNFHGFGVKTFELLHQMPVDVARILIANNAPSIEQLNLETKRMAALYPALAPQATVVIGNAAPTSTTFTSDSTTSWLTYPNYPSAPAPVYAGTPTLRDGVALQPGATSALFMRFGGVSGSNVPDRAALDRYLWMNPFTGNQNVVFGTDGVEQGNVAGCFARARRYAATDPNDLLPLRADGLYIKAHCAGANHENCTNGNVWGGFIRFPTPILPGMTVSVRYRTPAGPLGWVPVWLFGGEQISPGPGGNPYAGYGTASALFKPSTVYNELDMNDGWRSFIPDIPMGEAAPVGFVNHAPNSVYTVLPHTTYWSGGSGFVGVTSTPFIRFTSMNTSVGMHNLVMNIRGDGSNLVDYLYDGKLFLTQYWEYKGDTYVDPVSGTTKTVGMHLMIDNQAVPSFNPAASGQVVDNDGIPDGWSAVVEEVSIINGNISAPDSYRASGTNVAPAFP